MRTSQLILAGLVTAVTILSDTRPAIAQSMGAPVSRGDLSGMIGWLIVQRDQPQPFDRNDWDSSFYAGLGAGWYWTDYLKTEIDFGAGTESDSYFTRPITVQGRPTYVTTQSRFSQRTLGVSQHYQFFRNAWFHPHIAAGANITWESVTDEIYPISIFDPTAPPRLVEPGRTEGPRTDVTVSPFVSTGFKAYMSQRSFFRSDLRVSFRDGVDDVLLRLGFGIDF